MDETIKQLVEQVKVLTETLQLFMSRGEQLFKLQEDWTNKLPPLVELLTKAVEQFEIAIAAQEESVGDLDAVGDDMAKAVSALLEVVTPRTVELVKIAAQNERSET